jgi:hypothetical protein
MAKVTFNPIQQGFDGYRLARIQMPASPDLEEGFTNQCDIFLDYNKDKHRRKGRGYYLTLITCSTDGVVSKHAIFGDPASYLFVEGTKRFSRKKLEALVESVQTSHLEQIEAFVAGAVSHYENKGRTEATG